jgi:hypothetical protein
MSLLHVNLFIRNKSAHLLPGVWRTDLVIRYAYSGLYLIDQYPELIAQLQARYPGWSISTNPSYYGHNRIKIVPPAGTYIHQLEMDIPPGCYLFSTRCCFSGNEESNWEYAGGRCGDEACVHLMVPTEEVCARDLALPALGKVVANEAFILEHQLAVVKSFLYVGALSKAELLARANAWLAEATEINDTTLIARANAVITLVGQVVECC